MKDSSTDGASRQPGHHILETSTPSEKTPCLDPERFMPPNKLKTLSQEVLLGPGGGPAAQGVCYYMCNFLESDKGPWHRPHLYSQASASATNFAQGTTMTRYARTRNLDKSARQTAMTSYAQVTGALAFNRIYRVALWIGSSQATTPTTPTAPANATDVNHEIILITGANNDEILYFEPNFGFYEAQSASTGNNNRENFEHWDNWQYTQVGMWSTNFFYLDVRGLTEAYPLSFS